MLSDKTEMEMEMRRWEVEVPINPELSDLSPDINRGSHLVMEGSQVLSVIKRSMPLNSRDN
jgi:hypothetical protein